MGAIIISISHCLFIYLYANHRNRMYITMPKINATIPPITNFKHNLLLFILFYSSFASFSNWIDNSLIIYDFRSAVYSSLILFTILFTFPFIISSNSITLLLSASTFLFALKTFNNSNNFHPQWTSSSGNRSNCGIHSRWITARSEHSNFFHVIKLVIRKWLV